MSKVVMHIQIRLPVTGQGSSVQGPGNSQARDRSTSICNATNTSKVYDQTAASFPFKMSGAGYDVVVDVDEEVNH